MILVLFSTLTWFVRLCPFNPSRRLLQKEEEEEEEVKEEAKCSEDLVRTRNLRSPEVAVLPTEEALIAPSAIHRQTHIHPERDCCTREDLHIQDTPPNDEGASDVSGKARRRSKTRSRALKFVI